MARPTLPRRDRYRRQRNGSANNYAGVAGGQLFGVSQARHRFWNDKSLPRGNRMRHRNRLHRDQHHHVHALYGHSYGVNPIVGIQIATNGDAVIADFNQMEPGGFPLSPILTTSATANRSGDNVNLIGLPKTIVNGPNGAFVIALLGAASPTTAGSPSVLDKSAAENYMTFNSPTVIKSFINGSFRTATVWKRNSSGRYEMR